MKTLVNLTTKVEGNKVTITGEIVDREFQFPVQQVTVGFLADKNPRWARHVQISQEAVFVKRVGVPGFALMLEELITKVANIVVPSLTFPPLFRKGEKNSLTVVFDSELDPDLQWQQTDDEQGANWKDIPGATNATLDPGKLVSGTFVRCKASSEAGVATSTVVQV